MSALLMHLLFFLSCALSTSGCRILCSARLRVGTLALTRSTSPVMGSRIHMAPTPAPAHSPKSQGHHVRKHHTKIPHNISPSPSSPSPSSPSETQGCSEISCSDPLTSTPIGSPCGCVYPMQVEIDLGVAPYQLFSRIEELEIEVAAGTYLKQSQVRIMGANGSLRDADKTTVAIDLVPLGEKFDKMTALLTYERFWQKKILINMSLFGEYDVIYVHYPGLPASPPISEETLGPSGSWNHENPFTANVHSRSTQKMNLKIIVIIALCSIALISVCLGVFCILWRWHGIGRPPPTVGPSFRPSLGRKTGFRSILSSRMASSTSISFVSTMATCLPLVKTFSLAEIEKATNNFRFNKILGEGGFGRVYHGVIEDGSEVAVKLLTREDRSGDREFIAEVEMLSRLHHRNLVKLIGICIEKNMRCLVYEFVRNGSVESHLHGCDKLKGPLDWDARLKIALGAARALAYLHEDSNPHVIHRDFKASNVLLEEDFTPKVSDFGLAREALEGIHHISTQVMGTFGYVAPEYAMTGHLLVKSDVYSYGVVLLELLSGSNPVDMSQPQGAENLVTWARPLLTNREGLEQLIDQSLKGIYHFDKMAKVAAIASMCVHIEASQRPFMGEVVQALKLIYNDKDENCDGSFSCTEDSAGTDYEFKGEFGAEKSWWNEATPRLTYGCASSFVTMDYSSGPMEEMQRPHSTSNIPRKVARDNRSGPLRTKEQRAAFYRLRGSMSEHGHPSQRYGTNDDWF